MTVPVIAVSVSWSRSRPAGSVTSTVRPSDAALNHACTVGTDPSVSAGTPSQVGEDPRAVGDHGEQRVGPVDLTHSSASAPNHAVDTGRPYLTQRRKRIMTRPYGPAEREPEPAQAKWSRNASRRVSWAWTDRLSTGTDPSTAIVARIWSR